MNAWVERLKSRASRRELSNHRGETPLHEACYSGCSVHHVREILNLWPAQIACKDSCGRTPLHWALATKKHHEKAKELLSYWKRFEKQEVEGGGTLQEVKMLKKALLQKCDLGYTALDHACTNDAPSAIIEELLNYCPELALMMRGDRTPLHMLILHARSKEMPMKTCSIKLVLDAFPQAVITRDKQGNLPLHYCCYEKTNLDSFMIVLNATAECMRRANVMRNEFGHLPLHCASLSNAPFPVINALIDAYPSSLVSVDCEGNTALHLACKGGDRISSLLKSRLVDGIEGESVIWGMTNEKGLLPLQTSSNLDSWFELLRLVPQCIQNHNITCD